MADNQDRSAKHTSLFLLKENNVIRKQAKAIVEWIPFEYIILFVIIVNCIIIGVGLWMPDDKEHEETIQHLEHAEIGFLVIFIVEMMLKTIAYGFALHSGSYLRNPWNVLDFAVIIIGLISLIDLGIELNILRMLRAFRLLRLLRFCKLLCRKK